MSINKVYGEGLKIEVKNAIPYDAGWIAFDFYKLLDEGKIENFEVRETKRSPYSIDVVINCVVVNVDLNIAIGTLVAVVEIAKLLRRREKKAKGRKRYKTSRMEIYINGKSVEQFLEDYADNKRRG